MQKNTTTMNYKDWITQTKTAKPELADFITKLEVLISDTGFNASKFENAVENGLKKIETDVTKLLTHVTQKKLSNPSLKFSLLTTHLT